MISNKFKYVFLFFILSFLFSVTFSFPTYAIDYEKQAEERKSLNDINRWRKTLTKHLPWQNFQPPRSKNQLLQADQRHLQKSYSPWGR